MEPTLGSPSAPPGVPAPQRSWRGHAWALVVLLGALALVLTLWRAAYERELHAASLRFINNAENVSSLLSQQLVQYELVAGGGVSLFASVARPTPRQWYGYVEGMGIRKRFPAMVGLGFAGYVRQSRLGDLQLEWREAGWGMLEVRPRGMRRHYGPILYLEPQTLENRAAIGYDMYSEPVRRAAMERAMTSGQPALSGPVQLVQDSADPKKALLLYLPVYRYGDRPVTDAARLEAMLGWIYLPIRVDALVDTAIATAPLKQGFRIHDVTLGEQLLHASERIGSEEAPAFKHSILVSHYGRRWRLDFESPPIAEAVPQLRGLQTTLALGLFSALLLYAIAWMLAQTESRAHRIALKLTEDFRRSELRFRTAMEHSAIGKALLDSQDRIVEANRALGTIVGRQPSSLVGERFDSLFEDDVTSFGGAGVMETTDAEGVRRSTRRLHREGGVPRHAQLTYAPLPGNVGQDIVGLAQVEDVTERLRAEAQVHALNRTLEARVAARTRDLSRVNEELESFAYSVSHDLRAPLRAIEGFSRILVERHADALDESGRDYLGRVRNAASRMGELIDAMLKMSRLTRGAIKRETIDLSKLGAEVAEELAAGDRAHQAEVVITPGMQVVGDATLLRNLLVNLLGNAWKFTRGRESARIEFGCQPRGNDTEYFVRDNGAGFPQAYVDKLFRPFQRLHDQKDFAGHGIGLASVKRIVERHGGGIRAEGEEGEGATFYFTLPEDASIS